MPDPQTDQTPPAILFARQPIFDRQLRVVGYELLFRDDLNRLSAPAAFDGDMATNQVMVNAFIESAISEVCEGRPAFINMTRHRLAEPIPFSPHRVVLELLETIKWDRALHRDLMRLSEQGYRLAMDDFLLKDMASPLLRFAHIVKLEFPSISVGALTGAVSRLKGLPVQVLAEKVETRDEFRRAEAAGCDLFQGYFLARPEIVRGRRMPNNRLSVLRLLAMVNKPETDLQEVTALIRQDSLLSVRLLRVINSAALRRAQEVTSINTAVMLLGLDRIRALVSMLALTKLEDSPHALQVQALTRGRFCERLAARIGLLDTDAAFTVGLFSCLDAFFEVPLAELLDELPLHRSLPRAILHREGMLGLLLDTVLGLERGDWDRIQWDRLASQGADAQAVAEEYRDSLRWCAQVMPPE